MASNIPKSPRQKMINLMYLVFIAMLALNVPTEVLDGFDLVEEGLEQTIKSADGQNKILMGDLIGINNQNPEKARQWYQLADGFVKTSDSIYNYIQDLKIRIVKEADGKDGNLDNIKKKDNLNAATEIMLLGKTNEAQSLKKSIDAYRETAISMVGADLKKKIIEDRLSTKPPKKRVGEARSWEEILFQNMPTSAAITLLTKIQSDIRVTQGEVLSDLYDNIGAKDYRVNLLRAEVVPTSEFVMEGGTYEGRVVLTGIDTTKRPTFSVNAVGADGKFKVPAGSVGIDKVFKGVLSLVLPSGEAIEREFSSKYHVVPRMTAIQVEDANVLYLSEDNKLTISVPGMSNDQLRVTSDNGTLTKSGSSWIAKPTKLGEMNISVYNASNSLIDKKPFRVRRLPDPTPYFEYADANKNVVRYKSGTRITRNAMLAVSSLRASIDDGLLDRQFTVLSFNVVTYSNIGNRISSPSSGGNFTEDQMKLIRQLDRGRTLLITDVKVRGRDGADRNIASLEVRFN